MSQRQFINFASPLETPMSPDHLLQHQNSDTLLPRLSGNPESDLAPQENHSETATSWEWHAEYANGSNRYFSSAYTSNSPMTSQTYPPYLFSPGHQQVNNAVIDPQLIRMDNVILLTPETYHSANESFRSNHSRSARSSPSIKRPPATMMDDISDEDGSSPLEPYSQLIYRALKSVDGHAMFLKEIYEWFEKNTDKAKDPFSNGWQKSIRHNLTMNGAFRKVGDLSPDHETKKRCLWVLEESAVVEGVKSTTRYRNRKRNANSKGGTGETSAPLRQRSGAKGGRAYWKSAKMRKSSRMDEPNPFRLKEDTPAGFNSTSMIESSQARRIVDMSFSSDSMPPPVAPPVEQLLPEDHHYSNPSMATYASTSPDGPSLRDCRELR